MQSHKKLRSQIQNVLVINVMKYELQSSGKKKNCNKKEISKVMNVDLQILTLFSLFLLFFIWFQLFYLFLSFVYFCKSGSLGSQTHESQTRSLTSGLACITPFSDNSTCSLVKIETSYILFGNVICFLMGSGRLFHKQGQMKFLAFENYYIQNQ